MRFALVCWGMYAFIHVYVRIRHLIPNLAFFREWLLATVIATLAATLITSLRVGWIRGILSRGEIVVGKVVGKAVPGIGNYFTSPSLQCQYLYANHAFSKTRAVGRLVHEFEVGDELKIVVDREHPGRSLILAAFRRSGDKSGDSAKA